jgi:hypothetical protein
MIVLRRPSADVTHYNGPSQLRNTYLLSIRVVYNCLLMLASQEVEDCTEDHGEEAEVAPVRGCCQLGSVNRTLCKLYNYREWWHQRDTMGSHTTIVWPYMPLHVGAAEVLGAVAARAVGGAAGQPQERVIINTLLSLSRDMPHFASVSPPLHV